MPGAQLGISREGVESMDKGTLELLTECTARGLTTILSLGGVRGFFPAKWILPCEKFIHNMIAKLKEQHCSGNKYWETGKFFLDHTL